MAPYKALYGRKCRTSLYWTELSEKKILGVDLIWETEEKMKVGDKVFLKVSPWKKVLRFGRKKVFRFGRKGNLCLRFIGPYEIIESIGPVAHRLALPPELDRIHNYWSDPSHIISPTEVEIQLGITYSEEPIKIFVRKT
ncbi:DNA/RNA polymerases superfamily protein [Gossypium australe]|uniref:DNA/RNA polymerases superfamily protein n=1 Tax=Gossypium australe TaxID=47621 RepID=A0A5B6WG30_9ROSI|nr:DNA/RNA polymerases superfamily protein [Gossypium australe]